jgi:bacillolysin
MKQSIHYKFLFTHIQIRLKPFNMKNAIFSFALFLSLAFVAAFNANAQINPKFRIAEDRTDAQGNLMQAFFRTANQAPTLEEALTELKQRNHLEGRNELRLVSQETDELGMTHYRYQQYFAGVPVDMSEFLFHVQNGKVLVMNGEVVGVPENTPTRPLIQTTKAFDLAVGRMAAKKYSWQLEATAKMRTEKPQAQLVITRRDAGRDAAPTFALAYRFDVMAVEPVGKKAVYIDARSETVLHEQTLMADGCAHVHGETHHEAEKVEAPEHVDMLGGTASTRYSGSRSIETNYNGWNAHNLFDINRNIHTYNSNNTENTNVTEFWDNDNNWTWGEFGANNVAFDAHWGAEMSYDYFRNVLNRNGYDGLGSGLNVFANYKNNYNNAHGGSGSLWLGNGNGVKFRPLVSLDVLAHEFGHNVCEKTANLVYSYEPGALNEAFSDIWGVCVEAFAAPEKNHWLIGEEITLQSNCLRSMSNPNARFQPDTYGGLYWYSGADDNGGVHTNSGVLNYWFYLLSEGGSGTNDNGFGYEVAGIGMTKAAKIAYYMERYILNVTSQYSVINSAAQLSAMILYGIGSPEHQAVEDALDAVGLGYSNYCVSKGQNSSYEYIQQVALNGVEVNSGNDGGYGNHTNSIFTVTQGNTYIMNMTPGHPVAAYQEAWQVWIDLNRDGQFSDNEAIVGVSGTSAVSATVFIPVMQQYGATRMRVAMSYYNPASSPCSTFEWGEVEDFTINILKNTCTSASNNNSYEYIKYVGMIGMTNTTGAEANGYGDYTNRMVTLRNNDSHVIALRPGFSGDSYPEYWKGWIDFNGDGIFDNATEMIFDLHGSFYQITTSFSIPNTTGAKRLRICMSYDPISSACMNNAWGETEDYTVFVISNMGITGDENDPTTVETGSDEDLLETIIDENAVQTPRNIMTATQQVSEAAAFSLAPNPTTGIIRLQSEMPLNGAVKVEVFATSGQLLQSINLDASAQINESIDLGDQPDGLYLVRLSNGGNCKVKTVVLKK